MEEECVGWVCACAFVSEAVQCGERASGVVGGCLTSASRTAKPPRPYIRTHPHAHTHARTHTRTHFVFRIQGCWVELDKTLQVVRQRCELRPGRGFGETVTQRHRTHEVRDRGAKFAVPVFSDMLLPPFHRSYTSLLSPYENQLSHHEHFVSNQWWEIDNGQKARHNIHLWAIGTLHR